MVLTLPIRIVRSVAALSILTIVPLLPTSAQDSDAARLYGRVTTMDGDVLEGFLRWDQNEGHWTDVIDASKRIPSRYHREAASLRGDDSPDGRRSVRVLGFRFDLNGNSTRQTASSVIRFGHIQALQVLDGRHALITLKSGEEQEFRSSSTDLGRSSRGIMLRRRSGEELELDWDDIDFIDFLAAPEGVPSPFGRRMYGTVETVDGIEYTGWVAWDRDEIFENDKLDGDEGRTRRSIAFSDIVAIERASASSSTVTLRDGEEVRLRGTNDVNSGNRGITVSDPGLGRVRIQWHELDNVRFFEPSRVDHRAFDGGRLLVGTVTTQDGDEFTGEIRWDNDEMWTWEALDGESNGIELDVELGLIQSIERKTMRSVAITLRDGRSFDMRGSNDVNDRNKGIFVRTDEDELVLVEWEDFAAVVFTHRQ